MLDVLYVCDENYAPFAGVSVFSLLQQSRDLPTLRVLVLGLELSDASRENLKSIAKAHARELILLDGKPLAEELQALALPCYRGSQAANLRLLFERVLPQDTTRVLYLDCDTLVCGSVAELATLALGGKAVGAVRDSLTARYKRLLGLDEAQNYYNSGVLLIDVARWREQALSERVTDFLKGNRAPLLYPDQDLLNLALGDEIATLPIRYNFQPHHRVFSDKTYFAVYPQTNYYAAAELQAAREHPCILHVYRFIGEFPWHKGGLHPDTALWDAALAKTPWSGGYQKRPAKRGLVLKVEKILYRILPKCLFLRLFAKVTERGQKKHCRQQQK